MKTKIVYSIVSTENDIYLEETIVSIYSLRLKNKNCFVSLVVDEETSNSLRGSRKKVLEIIDELIVVDTPKEYSQKLKSRYLKTSIRQHLKGDFLFVDSDTVIADSLDDIDCFEYEIGAVYDVHKKLSENPYLNKIAECGRLIGWKIDNTDIEYFNSGVMYVKDTQITYDFYKQWHQNWILQKDQGIHMDQPPLGKTNHDFNHLIVALDGKWDCQILENGLPYLHNSKIIHYFNVKPSWSNASFYKFTDEQIYLQVKQDGYVNDDIVEYINNARCAFGDYTIVAGEMKKLMETDLFKRFRNMYFNYPRFAKIISFFC